MSLDTEKVLLRLNALLGVRIMDIGHAADLLWVGFGDEVEYINYKGTARMVNTYALHVQSNWRLTSPSGILLGDSDLYYPSDTLSEDEVENWVSLENFDSIFDQKADLFVKQFEETAIKVVAIDVDILGGLKIRFDNLYEFEVFPDSSTPREFWRFFDFISDEPHLVVFDVD